MGLNLKGNPFFTITITCTTRKSSVSPAACEFMTAATIQKVAMTTTKSIVVKAQE